MKSDQQIDAPRRMLLIRAHEDAAAGLQRGGRGSGTCTAVGQEAAAVGTFWALAPEAEILINHRSGRLLARGAHPRRNMAKILGRKGGYCGGKSSSLHGSARELGDVLTSTIGGGELALATGKALARKVARRPGVVAYFFGDGAACQRRFHESADVVAV